MSGKKYVVTIPGLEAEATTTASSVEATLEVVKMFLPGGAMWRRGDMNVVVIYPPEVDMPLEVARHVV